MYIRINRSLLTSFSTAVALFCACPSLLAGDAVFDSNNLCQQQPDLQREGYKLRGVEPGMFGPIYQDKSEHYFSQVEGFFRYYICGSDHASRIGKNLFPEITAGFAVWTQWDYDKKQLVEKWGQRVAVAPKLCHTPTDFEILNRKLYVRVSPCSTLNREKQLEFVYGWDGNQRAEGKFVLINQPKQVKHRKPTAENLP